MRFLDNRKGAKVPTVPILEDVEGAFQQCGFDLQHFKKRTGEWFDQKNAEF